jgi:hypothetical protein
MPPFDTRVPTALEAEHLKWSYQVPCLVCKHYHGFPDSPAEYHHAYGRKKPGCHFNGFSLCAKHHRIADTRRPKRWISRHGDGKQVFEARYRVEGAFVALQKEEIELLKQNSVGHFDGNKPSSNGTSIDVSHRERRTDSQSQSVSEWLE